MHLNPDVNQTPVQRIQRLLGEQVVVIWMQRGTKAPKFRGWQKQTIEHMRDPRYVANLNSGHNLGVLVGAPGSASAKSSLGSASTNRVSGAVGGRVWFG